MKRNFLITLFLIVSLGAIAQVNQPISVRSDERPSMDKIQAYIDSLKSLKDSVFTCKMPNVQRGQRLRRNDMRLFLPLTYYGNVAEGLFTRDRKESPILSELMHLYLTRPDLVEGTDRMVQQQQTKLDDIKAPIHHDPTLVEKVADRPVEPTNVPVEVLVKRPNFWTFSGDYALQFLQNYVSGNWYKGGESNYSALASLVMQANYNNKQKVKWENRLELKYGMQSSRSDSLHSFKSTEDLIRLTSKLGLQATKRWYYTVQFIGNTQFSHSYRSNDPKIYSAFAAPLNINLSIGMDYSVDWMNHRLKGNFHLAPLAYNMKYTRMLELTRRLGIKDGNHFLHDFGSEFTVDLEWQLMESLTWKTRLYGYSTYKRTELEWENTFTFRFNRYISSRVFIYPRFDDGVSRDDHYAFWQLKEFASIGFQYSF
ncbi:DUF3078 domain-containing protein [Prevotella melaninogenica]|uniref:DUF3078 domain-containing protein n=1 Tax=Prevotella melaninogenica TaxID=28132 RepID=UPI001C5D79D4|nr:DUF3078 domain-containing protein [Prevotella melaninogenica]MBW4741429.1 DUF3078 domain-containing protein [Prevotella melaninogenica]MBW4912638.1 DUF3078 domain-containing protein [Prevotella melaninogenica]